MGDRVIIEGVYKRRTFWQWLTRRPRENVAFFSLQEVFDRVPVTYYRDGKPTDPPHTGEK
jgi:hypothetical protein